MVLNLRVNRLAVTWGMVSMEMTITIPTIRRQATMVSAMNAIIRYSMAVTGRCCERANSASNATETSGRRKTVKKNSAATVSADKR